MSNIFDRAQRFADGDALVSYEQAMKMAERLQGRLDQVLEQNTKLIATNAALVESNTKLIDINAKLTAELLGDDIAIENTGLLEG